MRRLISMIVVLLSVQSAIAQITITSSDMPVSGDTLRYSFASTVGSTINLGDSGTSVAWNYTFTPTAQAVDTYRSALTVNPLYALTIGLSAYGYKVADSFPLPLPGISIKQVYTFFEKKSSPSRFEAAAFAASISGIPTPVNYDTPDVWYFFPLTYANNDSAGYQLNISIPGLGGIKQKGYRKSRVDAWGTITTPYYTTPVACIRVRSEIREIDTVTFGATTFGFPRNSVEYKWLLNGEHYPALWVTANILGGTETISSIRYRDTYRYFDTTPIINSVTNVVNNVTVLNAYPNPATDGSVTIDVPSDWGTFHIQLFDMQSKEVASYNNVRALNISALPVGQYIARVIAGTHTGYVQIAR